MDSGETESCIVEVNGEDDDDDPNTEHGDESDIDDDTSSDEEEREKLIDGKIQKLLLDVEASPFQYDKHIELISALRASFDLDRLRTAREAMASIYPLTEELWLEWFSDELPLATIPEQKEFLVSKFQLAVKDYTSVKVWHEYCQYMMNNIDSPADIDKARKVFEEAITAVGLHVTEGASIWAGYREFEIAILDSYQQLENSGEANGISIKIESQIERIAGLFKRQLAVPLLGLDDVYESFEDWSDQGIPAETQRLYQRASQKLILLMEYEEKLCNAEEKLFEYQSYIDYEIQGGDPARIQCIFERAIKDNCLDYELWTKYTDYLDFKLKIPAIAVSAHQRATRNCPWVGALWQNYLNAVERSGADSESYLNVFNEALKGGFTGKDAYLQLLVTKCDYFRRRITEWTKDSAEVKELLKSFESGIAYMEHYFGSDGDYYCVLLRERAFVEAKHLENVKGGQELWDGVMKKHSRNSNMWIEYLSFLKEFTDILTQRRAFQRAVQVAFENPVHITEEFLKFERRHGTLSDVESARQKIKLQLRKSKERKEREKAKESEKGEGGQSVMSNSRKKSKNKFEKKVDGRQEQPLQGEDGSVQPKSNADRRNKGKRQIETSPVSQPRAKKKPGEHTNGCEDQKPKEIQIELPAKDIAETTEPSKKVMNSKNITTAGNEVTTVISEDSLGNKEVSSGEITEDFVVDKVDSEVSVFLSNMPIAADETHIQELFAQCGEIEKTHIVRNIKGKSKGFAYLQFKEKDSVSKALALDRITMLNRPLYVSECTDKKVNPTQFQYPTVLDKRTLYVSNIPFEATAEQVKTHFSQNGTLKDLRLVTRKDGRTKGIAYAEYETEADAAAALIAFDKQIFKGRPLNVHLSNPPARKQVDKASSKTEQSAEIRPETESKTSYKGRTRDAPGVRGRAKTQISLVPRAFIPRSVATPKPGGVKPGDPPSDSASSTAATAVDSTASGPMNNSDFRKFLLK